MKCRILFSGKNKETFKVLSAEISMYFEHQYFPCRLAIIMEL